MNKKLVPDPPFNTTTPNAEASRTEELLKDREAIKRALDYYLDPPAQYTEKPRRPSTMFMVAPNMDTESLLAHAYESLATASVLTSDFANDRPAALHGAGDSTEHHAGGTGGEPGAG